MLRPDFSIQNMNRARRIRPPLAFLRVDHSIAPVGEMCRCRRCRRCRGTDFQNLIPQKVGVSNPTTSARHRRHRHILSDIGADVTGPMLSMSRRCWPISPLSRVYVATSEISAPRHRPRCHGVCRCRRCHDPNPPTSATSATSARHRHMVSLPPCA